MQRGHFPGGEGGEKDDDAITFHVDNSKTAVLNFPDLCEQ
jgi:hypothetical protein